MGQELTTQPTGLLSMEERRNQTHEEVMARVQLCMEIVNLSKPLLLSESDTVCDVPFLMKEEEKDAMKNGSYMIDIVTTARLNEMRDFLRNLINPQ